MRYLILKYLAYNNNRLKEINMFQLQQNLLDIIVIMVLRINNILYWIIFKKLHQRHTFKKNVLHILSFKMSIDLKISKILVTQKSKIIIN